MYNWNEYVAIYLIQILGDSELVLHMMKDYICPKRNIWMMEDAKAWHLSLRLNRKDRPTWAVDPRLDILSPPMNNYMREKSDKLMWTIKAFYGDFIRERNIEEQIRNRTTMIVYYDNEATIREKKDTLNKIFSEDRDWCEKDYLYPSMADVTDSIDDYRDTVESDELEDTLQWHCVRPYLCGSMQDCRFNWKSPTRATTIKIKRADLVE